MAAEEIPVQPELRHFAAGLAPWMTGPFCSPDVSTSCRSGHDRSAHEGYKLLGVLPELVLPVQVMGSCGPVWRAIISWLQPDRESPSLLLGFLSKAIALLAVWHAFGRCPGGFCSSSSSLTSSICHPSTDSPPNILSCL